MPDWGWTVIGSAAGVLGGLLLMWALLLDRPRGRLRCPGCWYDMAGAAGLRCPECGRDAGSERRLRKTRRRWSRAVLGVALGLLAWPAAQVPAYRQGGWIATIPSVVLVRIAPVSATAWSSSPPGGAPGLNMLGAAPVGGPAPPGPPVAPPPPQPPSAAYDIGALCPPEDPLLKEAIERLRTGKLPAGAHRVLLTRILRTHPGEVDHIIEARDAWAIGAPVVMRVTLSSLLTDQQPDLLVEARPSGTDLAWIGARSGDPDALGRGVLWAPAPAAWGVPVRVGDEVTLDVRIYRGVEREIVMKGRRQRWRQAQVDASKKRLVWSGRSPAFEIVGRAEEIVTPVEDRVHGPSHPTLVVDPEGVVRLGMYSFCCHLSEATGGLGEHAAHLFATDWSLGGRAEVLRDGVVMARAEVVYPMETPGDVWKLFRLDWTAAGGPPREIDTASAIWEVRLVGDPAIALRDLERRWCWSGEIVRRVESVEPSTPIDHLVECGPPPSPDDR